MCGPILPQGPGTVQKQVTEVIHDMQQENETKHDEDDDKIEESSTRGTPEQSKCRRTWSSCVSFYFTYEFLILVVVAILLAKAYPPLGAEYLYPEITATWIAVIFVFVMAGLGLKTSEFTHAFRQVRFNVFVQIYNFGVVSAIVFGIARLLDTLGALPKNLADGMVICSCLPMTINMVLILTRTAGGNEAAAIFNATASNMIGVFLSPVLILGYLGVTGDVDLASVFYKLALRVVLPLCVGQILQKTSKGLVDFVNKHKRWFKKAQMYTLVFIVYTVFCRTFASQPVSRIGDIFLMILFQFISLVVVMVLAWYALKGFFRNDPRLRVMGLFGCTHKTVAMGVPLINAIYDGNPNIGVYTLPLLIWHPMQLVIGSALAPRLEKWVGREKDALGISEDDARETQAEESATTDDNEPIDVEAQIPTLESTEPGQSQDEDGTVEISDITFATSVTEQATKSGDEQTIQMSEE